MSHFLRPLLLLALLSPIVGIASPDLIRKSLVRIQTVSQDPDYTTPWNTGVIGQGIGAGFVIAGDRILTNAHVVSNARMIWITREGDPNRYAAKIKFIAHDSDLAILQPLNLDFFKSMRPLEFNGIPEIESTVMVYGYPIGGDRASVTRGIVSRVDFQDYSHSGADSHLVIQIDAAINPGNSGGPVVQDGAVVGVAFQGYSGDVAQNTGYMIPTSVIKRFLKDIEDGHYDHYVDLALTWFPLYNPAARHALGLPDDGQGVTVSTVFGGGSSAGIVKPGDVILAIDGHAVASDGSVQIDGSDVELAEVIERKFKGEKATLKIIRDGKPLKLVVPLTEPFPFNLFANAYDVKPRYVLFGGLLFQPLDQNFVNDTPLKNSRTRYYFDHFLEDNLYKERPEIVILSNVLSDPVNAYADEFRQAMVDTINGQKIKTLDDVAAAFASPAETYVIEFVGASRPLVLEAKAVAAARSRILSRYGVGSESNLKP
ncbi:MAG: trypsin-like peptidase domain-containing protein [Terrimicrobiaceae bacterium]|nr:trypsin-like peptidase domain-containing protein [Terrimicrobiaceae bacterium]